jgi:hypothetical protein
MHSAWRLLLERQGQQAIGMVRQGKTGIAGYRYYRYGSWSKGRHIALSQQGGPFTALSDQGGLSPYMIYGVCSFKDRDSRPPVSTIPEG